MGKAEQKSLKTEQKIGKIEQKKRFKFFNLIIFISICFVQNTS
jgi:hypothetical protein